MQARTVEITPFSLLDKMEFDLAAPVLINGVRGNVAVVVQKQGKNKHHAHKILLPNGSVFVVNNKEAELSTASMSSNKTWQGLPNSSASTNSIHETEPVVNSSAKKAKLLPLEVPHAAGGG